MTLRDYALTMAHYNRWMNEKVYATVAPLSDAERKQERGAFFGSIHGTLNHLLLGDQAWMQRFQGEAVTMKSPRDELFADFEELRAAREAMDAKILAWAETLTDEQGDSEYRFYSVSYQRERALPMRALVMQLFNHQTHHRGQLSTLLSQAGLDAGITDLPWMPFFD
jgi:uncharacterized damage-inducible protein DinB